MRSARILWCSALVLCLCQCVESSTSERKELCHLPGDEDGDGLFNGDDPDCDAQKSITLRESCDDGRDNDGDGFTDCEDTECAQLELCTTEQCARAGDEDGNGKVNLDDPACEHDPTTLREDCVMPGDEDGDGKADCEDTECEGARGCFKEDCIAPGDEDGDGKANCLDEDCRAPGVACAMNQASVCSLREPFVCQGGERLGMLNGLDSCRDNIDNDHDQFTDCNDADCKDSCSCKVCVEICGNGMDDNMNDVMDDGCPCELASGKTQGVCSESILSWLGSCSPPSTYHPDIDFCGDTLDNDCNGVVDDGCPCNFQGIDAGVCRDAVIDSSGTCARPIAYAERETMSLCGDQVDNDCDGMTDEEDSQCE